MMFGEIVAIFPIDLLEFNTINLMIILCTYCYYLVSFSLQHINFKNSAGMVYIYCNTCFGYQSAFLHSVGVT